MKPLLTTFLTLATILSSASPIQPATSTITGSGTWDTSTTSTLINDTGATWSFEFTVADTLGTPDAQGFYPTSISNASFSLNGTSVSETPALAVFFRQIDGGLFELRFSN